MSFLTSIHQKRRGWNTNIATHSASRAAEGGTFLFRSRLCRRAGVLEVRTGPLSVRPDNTRRRRNNASETPETALASQVHEAKVYLRIQRI